MSSLTCVLLRLVRISLPRLLTEARMNMTKSGLAYVYCVYCV